MSVRRRLVVLVKAVVLGGLMGLTAAVAAPSAVSAQDGCDCACVLEFGYCYTCEGGSTDCVYSHCNGSTCYYTWGFDCDEIFEIPHWAQQCLINP